MLHQLSSDLSILLAWCKQTGDDMKIDFRLSRNDHRVIEDFLAQRPEHVGALVVEAPNLERQAAAIELARSVGVEVVVELHTERLAFEGFEVDHLDYVDHLPLNPAELVEESARTEFVKRVVAVQDPYATQITAPSFHADSRELLSLNLRLADATATAADQNRPIRAVLSTTRSLLVEQGPSIVGARYRAAGVGVIDLRISPLGGDDEGPAKIRSVLQLAETIRGSGLHVTLGHQGVIGPVALALDAVDSFSVGVGQREQYNFRGLIASQRRSASGDRGEEEDRRGPISGIRLPALDLTAPRGLGRALIADRGIRSRLGIVADTIEAPAGDPRPAYLQNRHHQVAALADLQNGRWRAVREVERIARAIELRQLVNSAHLPDGFRPLKIRTLSSMRGILEEVLAD